MPGPTYGKRLANKTNAAQASRRRQNKPLPLSAGITNSPLMSGGKGGRETYDALNAAIYNFRVRGKAMKQIRRVKAELPKSFKDKAFEDDLDYRLSAAMRDGVLGRYFGPGQGNKIYLNEGVTNALAGVYGKRQRRNVGVKVLLHELAHASQTPKELNAPRWRVEGQAELRARKLQNRIYNKSKAKGQMLTYPKYVARYKSTLPGMSRRRRAELLKRMGLIERRVFGDD